MSANTMILCPTARLARSIQNDIARQYIQAGKSLQQCPDVQILSSWLSQLTETLLLAGHATQPPYALSQLNEQLLWEDVITASLKSNAFGDLFDISGLASAAMEANRYMIAWNLHVPQGQQAEETRQFLRWQRAFQQRCQELNALETVRYMDWQLSQLPTLKADLPSAIQFAGFDKTDPQEQQLREVLASLGVDVSDYCTTAQQAAQALHCKLENADAELRAAVAWVQQQFNENPHIKLAIVSPNLSDIRNALADLLDDVFYPLSVRPGHIQTTRHYNFSLGTPLAQQPIIQARLNLLRLIIAHQLQQPDVSAVLLSPFFPVHQFEADACARFDASMREKLSIQFGLPRLLNFMEQRAEQDEQLVGLLQRLQHAVQSLSHHRQSGTQWAQNFAQVLATLLPNNERAVSSLEFQALKAWAKALQQLAQLDVLNKKMNASAALHYLQQICSNQIFQAETEHEPSLQILGIMEGLSAPVDAIWCMHMNDELWPPPAKPNPLLPAFIQRAAALPNADNTVQAIFASNIHQRLLHSAKHIMFSSSKTKGDSQLRPSPLMQDIQLVDYQLDMAMTLAEQIAFERHVDLDYVDDATAPEVKAGEHVHGGTGLLKAQAVCPAWAFYQYRLGAKALKSPSAGLDNMDRGSLVHGVLERFWRKRHFADLRDMNAETLMQTIHQAVQQTMEAFAADSSQVSATVLTLEAERLCKLIADWLAFEKERSVSFRIVDCEIEKKVQICGIEITLKIDRLHQLEDGGLEFVDYKTGQTPQISSWGDERITEPQLPIYASFFSEADSDQISGVYFGMVKTAEHDFSGVSAENFEVEQGKRKPLLLNQFSDWEALLTHWKTAIENIAREVRAGEAAVRFADESDLAYCEVKPLLRLPERKLQFERFQEK